MGMGATCYCIACVQLPHGPMPSDPCSLSGLFSNSKTIICFFVYYFNYVTA
ncbi:hypothetical protein SERLA73DRAFT_178993 [Serpula lacrymans var. lacrymans S7.3]|uniref:Uncharacterized protein n=1 Tax=Serpula lacrymans var. lacrymans (strain S7.3) TaxID=936435 RepID=F8PTF2_SERL3|nr:hypothetical protein SERLA73DRAFT_178993 [Serpula lacrymans var. lacrymans S7.3]